MKFCNNCGTELKGNVKFCAGCGTAVGAVGDSAAAAHQPTPYQEAPFVVQRNNGPIIAAIGVATVALGLGGYLMMREPAAAPVVAPAASNAVAAATPTPAASAAPANNAVAAPAAAPVTAQVDTKGTVIVPPSTAPTKIVVVQAPVAGGVAAGGNATGGLPAQWFKNYRDVVTSGYVSVYTTGPARVRQFPTTRGGGVNGTLPSGSQVSGVWVKGADASTRWLRTDGYPAGYVWEGNLR